MASRGFALVEVVLAALALAVGLLALAGSAAGVCRMAATGWRSAGAAAAAGSLAEDLLAAPCPPPQTGDTIRGPFHLHWSTATSDGVAAVAIAVSYPDGRLTRSERYETARACP